MPFGMRSVDGRHFRTGATACRWGSDAVYGLADRHARIERRAAHRAAILRPVKLHPNPPRMVTVVIAVALAAVGLILAWPIDSLVGLLAPVGDILAQVGLGLDRQTGFICLFASPGLLVIGSLLPGI